MKKGMDVKKYGGYKTITSTCFALVESEDKKGRTIRSIEAVPLYLKKQFESGTASFEEYCDCLLYTSIRDGYVPYEDNFVQRDMGSLTGVNHGVSIRLSMTRANSATEALAGLLEDYTKRLEDKGLSILDSDTPSTDVDDTVGLLPAIYINDEGRQIFTVLYADIRDDGTVDMLSLIHICSETPFSRLLSTK